MRHVSRPLAFILLALAFVTTGRIGAQTPAQTPSQFYLQYRKAFDAAKKIEDVMPFMSAATRKQVEATPAAARAELFGMIKTMGTMTDITVVKETRTPTGATLTVTGTDATKVKATGTVEILNEQGAWKVGDEKWKS